MGACSRAGDAGRVGDASSDAAKPATVAAGDASTPTAEEVDPRRCSKPPETLPACEGPVPATSASADVSVPPEASAMRDGSPPPGDASMADGGPRDDATVETGLPDAMSDTGNQGGD
jgi:hypothetical protein